MPNNIHRILGLNWLFNKSTQWAKSNGTSQTAPNKSLGLIPEAYNPKHITQSTRTPMQHHLGPFSSTPVLFTSSKKNHIKPMKPKYAYITILGLNIIGFIEGDSWSPSISQLSTQNSWRQPISGSREDWTQADKRRLVCLLLAEPILGFILLKKRRTTAGPSPPTWQEQPAHHFQIVQNYTAHPNSPLHRKPWFLVLFTQQISA